MNLSKPNPFVFAALLVWFCAPLLAADHRKIDPTFLYRATAAVGEKRSDLTTPTCHYKPLFGRGDAGETCAGGKLLPTAK